MEDTIRHRVRRRIRDIGYRVVFPNDEPWQSVVELFAIAGLERMHRGYGENPWFWVVAWPTVFGAAAVDFWPEVGTPPERRMIASDAAAQHLEAVLIRAALNDHSAIGVLPSSAIKGLRAIGQNTLPAIPAAGPDINVPDSAMRTRTSKSAPGFAATSLFSKESQANRVTDQAGDVPTGQQQTQPIVQQPPEAIAGANAWSAWAPPPLRAGGQAVQEPQVAASRPVAASSSPQPSGHIHESQSQAIGMGTVAVVCPECQGPLVWMTSSREAYEEIATVTCDRCEELCGMDAPSGSVRPSPFLHCGACRLDLCEACGGKAAADAPEH